MGLNDVMNNGYTPKENQEFGNKKKLIGDAVCEVELTKITSKKGKEWIILKGSAINAIPDDKGRETTVEAGDEISKLYDASDNDAMQELMDDLFTAGIKFEVGATEEETFNNARAATEDKLVYFRTWAKTKPADKQVAGQPDYWQNTKVLSASKLTTENSTPQVAF